MPLTSSAVDAFGVVTLVLVILLCLVGVCCVAYVLYFRSKIRKEQLVALRDFNSLWIVRIILIVFAILWGLGELLRLPLLRREGWLLHSLSFQWQANMCRAYILISLGFLEPCYFLTALFLVHGSLRNAPFTPRKSWNGKVIALILIFCLPVFLLQLFLVVISPSFEFRHGYDEKDEGYGKLPKYFTRTFMEMGPSPEAAEHVAVCTYPLLSTLVLALFGCFYIIYFLYLGWRLFTLVINRRLQLRVYGLVIGVVFLLPVHVLFLGFSVLSTPSEPIFEALGFMGFLTVLLCTTVGEGILVIRPIADALAVRWVFESSEKKRKLSVEVVQSEPLLVPLSSLSVFGTDRDDGALLSSQGFLRSAVGHVDRDTDSMIKEVSLEPMGDSSSYHDRNGILISSPDSPELPGKPLVSHSLHSLV
ncbi:hypothetical protein R1flu_024617 [Riccia fluitans]|uniref:Uncharacterized protein n=1 Tax=Riccia fluitans TaxID=41844 RepID=A0ABD1XVT6_9MARC